MSDAILWTPEGTIVVTRTPAGFKIAVITNDGSTTIMSASYDDVDTFTDNLREMLQYA